MDEAPLRNDLADGPEGAVALWCHAADGVRLRVAGWRAGGKGTILIFNGRTEYSEKYGRVARDFAEAGYATLTLDWRGQGLSDRVASNNHIGHVKAFEDYQLDVAAFLAAAADLKFPEPYYLVGHSMGGAIGLRALVHDLPVKAASFSAPMWGIRALTMLGPLATFLLETSHFLGMGLSFGPGTNGASYVLKQPFDGNALTHDPATYGWLQDHVRADARLGLGGPSMNWLREAKAEFGYFGSILDVPCPTLAFLGTDESIVLPEAIKTLATRWPNAALEMIDNAYHEPFMEAAPARNLIVKKTLDLFDGT